MITLTKKVDLPKEIPPGKYLTTADAYTKDKSTITCLKASVAFHRFAGLDRHRGL